jgi:hypothetical protein
MEKTQLLAVLLTAIPQDQMGQILDHLPYSVLANLYEKIQCRYLTLQLISNIIDLIKTMKTEEMLQAFTILSPQQSASLYTILANNYDYVMLKCQE